MSTWWNGWIRKKGLALVVRKMYSQEMVDVLRNDESTIEVGEPVDAVLIELATENFIRQFEKKGYTYNCETKTFTRQKIK